MGSTRATGQSTLRRRTAEGRDLNRKIRRPGRWGFSDRTFLSSDLPVSLLLFAWAVAMGCDRSDKPRGAPSATASASSAPAPASSSPAPSASAEAAPDAPAGSAPSASSAKVDAGRAGDGGAPPCRLVRGPIQQPHRAAAVLASTVVNAVESVGENAASADRTASLLPVKSLRIWSVDPIEATATRSAVDISSATHITADFAAFCRSSP